jgi:hypothetical protein
MRKDIVKIEVKIIKENKDGSANAQVTFDKQGLETLVQWGLVAMLIKAVDEYAIKDEKTSKINKTGNVSHHKNGKITTKKVKL